MQRKRKALTALLLALALASAMAASAFAADTATVEADGVRVRRGASTSTSSLAMLSKGDTVTVKSAPDENGWVEVSYTDADGNSGTGYILSDFLKLPESAGNTAGQENEAQESDAQEEPAAQEGESQQESEISSKVSYTATVNRNGVRIRKSNSKESDIVTTLAEGVIVTVLDEEDENGWVKVSYTDGAGSELKGYILSDYLDINAIGSGTVNTRALIIREEADETSAIVGLAQEGELVDIYASVDGWYKIECGAYSGFVDSEGITSEASSTCVGYGVVTAKKLNLRAKPSTDGEKLTSIPAGVTFQITSDETEGWYSAIFNGVSGYVSADYVTVSDSIDSGYIQVTASSLALRAGPGTEFARLNAIHCGELLTVEGTVGDWYLVTYEGFTGYVNGAYVSATTKDGYQAYPDRVKITASSLTLRDGVGTSASKLASIPSGTVVAVSGLSYGWYKVTYNGQEGYVNAAYTVATTESVTVVRNTSNSDSNRSSSRSGSTGSSSGSKSSSNKSSSSGSGKSSNSSGSNKSSSGSSSSSKTGAAVLAYAKQFYGNPYKWGGTSLTKGADCSGFVKSVYAHFGVTLPHSSRSMRSVGTKVSTSDMQPGDIVCYDGHVGIYAGNGKLLSALGKKWGITYCSVYYDTILSVRRIF